MAIIHRAQITPSKTEVLRDFLASREWGSTEEIEVLGAYRFDDPDGEVGVECHLVRAGDEVFHLPLTYRGALSAVIEEAPIATMQHSVLGERFVYDGLADEVALSCFLRALCGTQQQAELDVYDGATQIAVRPQSVRLSLETDEGAAAPSEQELLDGEAFTIARTVGGLDGAVRLRAAWDGGDGIVAAV
ncbi:maltokinase N-terminal cap-like domain-containing protein [Brachybacterium sp. DNPG3]